MNEMEIAGLQDKFYKGEVFEKLLLIALIVEAS